jgi:serine/threonine protein kinase
MVLGCHLQIPLYSSLRFRADTPTQLCIVMEFCGDGDLDSYVKKKGRLSEDEARTLFVQLVSAVQHCHTMNVIHRQVVELELGYACTYMLTFFIIEI